jgi:mono/diheme cytochrome c family protein
MRRAIGPVAAAMVAASAVTIVFSQTAGTASSAPPLPPGTAAGASAPTASPLVERGRYLVALGDCMDCHTPAGAQPFSGGRPVSTPFGTVLSANLTSDAATGIGRYTADTFYRAMHEGIDHEGRNLYPAFPYNNYTNVTREDTDAIYAYMRTVPAVQHEVDRNQLKFPFNVRALMTVWNWMFLDKGPLHEDTSKSAQWNRGAYIVQGLGHCEACHTARNLLGGQKHEAAFQGGAFDTWFAPDITPNRRTGIGGWSSDDLLEFFREGRNVHSAASGEMGEVVGFSTSQMNDADLAAVLAYLADRPTSPDIAVAAPNAGVMTQGQAIWQDACSACHRMEAQGVPRYFPPMKSNANLQQNDPTTVVHYILAGAQHRPTQRAPTPLSMPAFDWKLDDAQVAAVATYARNSWGNSAAAVTTEQVADLRKKLATANGNRLLQPVAPTDLTHPGPSTLGTANTDSRDNGTGNAGRAAP